MKKLLWILLILLSGTSSAQIISEFVSDLETNITPADSLISIYLKKAETIPMEEKRKWFDTLQFFYERFSSDIIIKISNEYVATLATDEIANYWSSTIDKIRDKPILDSVSFAFGINTLGEFYANHGEADKAIACFKKVVDLFPIQSMELELAYAFNNLAVMLNGKGDPASAVGYSERALEIFKVKLDPYHQYLGILTNNIGMAHGNLGNFDLQLKYLLDSKNIKEKVYDACHYQNYACHINLGITYRNLKDYDLSEHHFLKALDCIQTGTESENTKYIKILMELSITKEVKGPAQEEDELSHLFHSNIKKAEALLGAYHPGIGEMYNNYGVHFFGENKGEFAVQYLLGALKSFNPKTKGITVFEFPSINQLADIRYNQLLLINNLAASYYLLYEEENDIRYLETSFGYFSLCYEIGEYLKAEIFHGDSRSRIKKLCRTSLILSNRTSIELYRLTNNSKYLQNLFNNNEKIKNWDLLERYAFNINVDSLPEAELLLEINHLKNQIVLGNSDSTIDSVNLRYNKLVADMEKTFPTFYEYVYGTSALNIRELQQYCRNEIQDWLIFLELPYGNFGTMWVNQDTIKVTGPLSDTSLIRSVNVMEKSIREKSWDFLTPANLLYQLLIAPYLNLIKTDHLVILPSHSTMKIPFYALVSEEERGKDVGFQYHYLINDYIISTQYSATLALRYFDQTSYFSKPIFIAPQYSGDLELDWNIPEVNLSRKEVHGKILKTFKRLDELKSEKFDLLHFAGHIKVSDHSDSTYLLLNKERDSIFLKDIFTDDIHTSLVVLSGCESALGERSAEALIGPAYAFTFAGSPNVISTLWKVNDESTANIFHSFYKNLKEGDSSIEALRKAQMQFLSDAPKPERHPYYWAPLTYYGNEVFFKDSNPFNRILWLAVILLLTMLIIIYRKIN